MIEEERRGEDAGLPYLLVRVAQLNCYAGDVVRAAKLADRGHELALAASNDSLASYARAIRALVYAHEGRVAETRATAAEAMQGAAGNGRRTAAFWACSALGLLERSLGDDAAVLAALAPLLPVVERDGVLDPDRMRYVPDAIEALINLGHLERADGLTRQLDERARALGQPTAVVSAARCHALLQVARGDVPMALDTISRALGEVGEVGVPLELARALIVKGQLERRYKRKRQATDSLEQAVRICEEIQAALWAKRAHAELARLARRHDPDRLTATEAQIARLAASGLTTREIAAAAFLSPKTVEANITRIYRKLGVHSRVQLANSRAGRADEFDAAVG